MTAAARYFAVGPVRELGEDLGRAVQQLGGGPHTRPGPARGFVLVTGHRYCRLPARMDRAAAQAHARGTRARLGEAVALVGAQVIYRDVTPARAPVGKAIDPRSPSGFLRIMARIAQALRSASQGAEAEAVRQAISRLDVDWPRLSEAGRVRIVQAANQALAGVPAALLPKVQEVLGVEARRVVAGTRTAVKRDFGLRIAADLTRTDDRIARFVAESQTNFIRDEYGRRQGMFSERARHIVSDGIAQGLGRDDISRELREAFQHTAAARSAFYWDVVAAAFVGRARSLAEVASYEEAGVSHYIITAVLDEVTTDICRYLDGKRFSVAGAMDQFRRARRLRDPEAIKLAQPWLRVRQDREGNRAIFVPTERGAVRAAIVADSAERRGLKDERGTFRAGLDAARLETVNVGPPPYHGLCRTTTVPEV